MFVLSPASWYWQDGRYDCYLPPLLALVLAVGSYEGAGSTSSTPASSTCSSGHGRHPAGAVGPGTVEPRSPCGWSRHHAERRRRHTDDVGGGGPVRHAHRGRVLPGHPDVAPHLHLQVGRPGCADHGAPSPSWRPKESPPGTPNYWVAYKLDFLSRGRLTITTAGYDADRSRTINKKVMASIWSAYLFVSAPAIGRSTAPSSARPTSSSAPTASPSHSSWPPCSRLGVPHRIISTGILQAVVPYEPISLGPSSLPRGLPGTHELSSRRAGQPSSRPATIPSRMSASETRHSSKPNRSITWPG